MTVSKLAHHLFQVQGQAHYRFLEASMRSKHVPKCRGRNLSLKRCMERELSCPMKTKKLTKHKKLGP